MEDENNLDKQNNLEKTNQEINVDNPPKNQTNTVENSQIVDIDKKLQANKKKKRKFLIKLGIGLGILTLLGISVFFFLQVVYFNRNKPIIEDPPPIITPEPPVEKIKEYHNDVLKINFSYPKEAIVKEYLEGDAKKVEVIYSEMADNLNEVEESTLSNGYIFRITQLKTQNRNLRQMTEIKRESYSNICPNTSNISEISETKVNEFDAFSFTIQNCGSDYKVMYTKNFDYFYEFNQIYSGDIGYRQRYGAITDEILYTFSFYPPIEEPKGETKTYLNENLGFSFEHPYLDEECCTIETFLEDKKPIVTLGKNNPFLGGDAYDILGIFYDAYPGNFSFETYLQNHKQTLIDDYLVVKGTEPDLKETEIKIGDRTGILLEGYSWKDYKYVYIDISDIKDQHVLILVINNVSGETFSNILENIYSSFEFFDL